MLPLFFASIAFSCPEEEYESDYTSLHDGISQQEICDQSNNLYVLSLSAGEILYIDILFSHVQGDLDLYLYEMNDLELIRSSTTSSDNESISFRAFEDISLLLEIVHHPSVSSSVDTSISYVIDVQMNVGTCEDSWTIWNSQDEESPIGDENSQDVALDMSEPPKWSYTKDGTGTIAFSSEILSETEMIFQESICLYSEHWYQFEGHLGEVVNFALTYPKQIPSRHENGTPFEIEKNHLQAHLYDEVGNLFRIVSFEDNGSVYTGQTSIDFVSEIDLSNVYLRVFRRSDVDEASEFSEEALSYQLDISREIVSICEDDDFDGNVDFDHAVDINTGSYILQACTDDYFVVFLEGNYDILLEHELEDGELDLIVYDDLFQEISRSVGSTGEESISLLGEGSIYIHIYLQEDMQTDGVTYTLSIYPTDIGFDNDVTDEEDRIYVDTGFDAMNDDISQKSGCSMIMTDKGVLSHRVVLFFLSCWIPLVRRRF